MTRLADGTAVIKNCRRLEVCGTIDEASAQLGLAMTQVGEDLREPLLFLAHRLYSCASMVAFPADPHLRVLPVTSVDIEFLERTIDSLEAVTGPTSGFVLCVGTEASTRLHVIRTVLRRAERRICALYEEEPGPPEILRFINRASDFLFACARYVISPSTDRTTEVMWDPAYPIPVEATRRE